jgi:preprotein translocase subunit SecY
MNSKNDFFAIVFFLVAFVVISITWYVASTNAKINLPIEQTKAQLIDTNTDTGSNGSFPLMPTINGKSVYLEFER